MNVLKIGIDCLSLGVGTLTAKACQATWKQASIFTAMELAVCHLLIRCLPPLNDMSLRQRLVIDLTSRIIGCLSGVLATHLLCEKTIQLRSAIIAQFASSDSAHFLIRFYMGERDAACVKVKFQSVFLGCFEVLFCESL